jgi:hypothetical protein
MTLTRAHKKWLTLGVLVLASVALLAHGTTFDFFCDDAFITLRYSKNWAVLGEPTYNIGEKVEGFTSFLFMALTAGGIKLGIEPVLAAQILCGASSVLLMVASWMLFQRVEPRHKWAGVFVLIALAASAPVAAWSLGGLETPMFGALVALGIAFGADAAGKGGFGRGALAGATLALATLARPEGAALTGIVGLVTFLYMFRTHRGPWALAGLVVAWGVIIGPFFAWRWAYYGWPLPNTYYVKTTGKSGELLGPRHRIREDGAARVRRAAHAGADGGHVLPRAHSESRRGSRHAARASRRAVDDAHLRARDDSVHRVGRRRLPGSLSLLRAALPAHLRGRDVRRVPHRRALPARRRAHCGRRVCARDHARSVRRAADRHRTTLARNQRGAPRARRHRADGMDARHGAQVERHRPLDLRARAAGDSMVTGAAGAMPFYAGLKNLDVLGLCDEWVAHNGTIIGSRPGHQREAPQSYILSKRATFMMIYDHIEARIQTAEARSGLGVEGLRMGGGEGRRIVRAPRSPFFHYFLMRQDRAAQMLDAQDLDTALGKTE